MVIEIQELTGNIRGAGIRILKPGFQILKPIKLHTLIINFLDTEVYPVKLDQKDRPQPYGTRLRSCAFGGCYSLLSFVMSLSSLELLAICDLFLPLEPRVHTHLIPREANVTAVNHRIWAGVQSLWLETQQSQGQLFYSSPCHQPQASF